MRTVLLVETSPELRRVLEDGLQRSGFVVRTAVNGEEALDVLRQRTIDLLVADAANGLDVRAALRQIDLEFPGIPAIVLSRDEFDPTLLGTGGPGGARRRLLPTPFRLAQLLSAATRMLADSGTPGSAD